MKYTDFIVGPQVGVAEMAQAKERRVEVQQQLLSTFQTTLISFTLNIMGPTKVFPLAEKTFEEGKTLIVNQCTAYGLPVIHEQELRATTGNECFFVVKAPAKKVKAALCALEQDCSLGRLFDMDVLDVDGQKQSRLTLGIPSRTCLLCNNNAFICGRSRSHSIELLLERVCQMMWDYFAYQHATKLANVAVRALLREVLATPKPGLVDRQNTGAHADMDIHTFERSALALMPYFVQFALYGIDHCGQDGQGLLQGLRPLGIKAELAMRKATQGVNTHKGAIFSMGLLTCALGVLYGKQLPYSQGQLRLELKALSASLEADFQNVTMETATSHGERLYAQHGLRGVRGEAIDGFPHLFDLAYPRFYALRNQGMTLNDAGIITLIDIIANVEDSNIVARSDYATMQKIAMRLRQDCQIPLEEQDYLAYIHSLDQQFTAKNISAGGSADLLAMTYFLYFLEKEVYPCV
ncbi:triphosphoribosyl-dephospho-CoA synthase CitG [Bengtsoniella intestinalis]|uniref:triphosphoribosyl-dephospho-CoA synthase CitG n=1 Tax=Bengtsoniella intestinalis TaxID=3073143 RepID=UPI00391F5F7C